MIKKALLSVGLAVCLGACSTVKAESVVPQEYLNWLDSLKKEMVARGISQTTVDEVFAVNYYHEKPAAVAKDRKQLEFVLTSDQYLNRIVSKARVEKGQKLYRDLNRFLAELEKKYALPGEYIIAFWGMETNYGSTFGGYNVIDALTEMSYDKRRAKFFKNELYNALKIIDTWHVDFTKMQGSWAGAMGHFQFMPSTFNMYAVDFNNDGKIDIWSSFEDAAASAANYLTSIGWKKDEPWGAKAELPWNFDYAAAGRNKPKKLKDWKKIGVKILTDREVNDSTKFSVIIPEGQKGQAYLIGDNFYKIMHWNRSENYALAIGLLADYIKSGQSWRELKREQSALLKTEDVVRVQSFINSLGWFKLDEDGQLGSKTRDAIKKVQKKAGLPQDGYPDYRLLQKIDNYNKNVGFSVPVPKRKLHKAK